MVDNVPQLKRRGFSVSFAQSRVHWQPAADVYRTSDGWLIKIELAGVAPDEVQIRVAGNRLFVAGHRRDAFATAECCECRSLEIIYSQFERVFDFPEVIERSAVRTEYRNGLLALRLVVPERSAVAGDTVVMSGDTVTIPAPGVKSREESA